VHGLIHVIVENQIALGDKYPAKSVLSRLIAEGLDRHDAVHAIGSMLTGQFFDAVKQESSGTDLNAQYLDKLNQLTAADWIKKWSWQAMGCLKSLPIMPHNGRLAARFQR
jgi:hypothetical protein